MEYLNIVIGLAALAIAVRAWNLQRLETIKNGKINSLVHTAAMIQDRIDYHSRIIDDMRDKGKPYSDWEGHEKRINKQLRPLKDKVNREFLNTSSLYDGVLHETEIRKLLKLENS